MAQAQGFGRRYLKAFFKGFFVAVPVTVTFLDRVACVARVEGASMQVLLEMSPVCLEIINSLSTDSRFLCILLSQLVSNNCNYSRELLSFFFVAQTLLLCENILRIKLPKIRCQ